ncbi:SusC/RagA family TonB-linked outer membrane protein [Mucilaginibacter boryungensis]|uniref:TonB-dependent receptor n=1 Tax=Mucilaginibacter boryungensis TaxID=768480 RepID=A0ABR9XEK2_9SPHI|nr:TonB-dependent receptor [Mucilaginibacter boryungensis]MBE9665488.1 TonB-dependent receptor [Mucilaginibacter boryungensis]
MKILYILLIFSLVTTGAFAQAIQVKGTVSDSKGASIPGVSIMVEGTKIGTVSSVNGQYVINVPNGNATLVFTSLGYVTNKVQVNGRRDINVTLSDDEATSLTEVQVVGYGTQKKISVTAAISNIEMKDLRRAAPSNLSNSLGGRVPGLIARMGDGAVGGIQNRYQSGTIDDAQIFIRGKGTLNNSAALVLIDGVEGSLSRLNPEDIDQISVLKDASATAVYGVRGANGVIIVTTRKGVAGKPRVSVTTQLRMMKPLDFPKFVGSYDYATLYDEAQKNLYSAQITQGVIPSTTVFTPLYSAADIEHYRIGDDPYGHPDVNWAKAINKDHYFEKQGIGNISGGTDKVTYYLSGEYDQSGGLAIGNSANGTDYNAKRYNLRSNLDFNITKTTQLAVKLNGLLNDLTAQSTGESSGQRVNGVGYYYIVVRAPNEGQPYNPNGSYNWGKGLGWNGVADLLSANVYKRVSNNLSSNFVLNQDLKFITPGLSAKVLYGLTYGAGSTKTLVQGPSFYSYDVNTGIYTLQRPTIVPSYTAVGDGFQPFTRNQELNASLNYAKTIAKDHNITALAVATQSTSESQLVLPRYFQGVSGRVTYDYKHKYLVEGNVGYNGSDAFNKDHRYALFPAAGLGWVISEEKFVKDNIKALDFLKIRADYGEVGNDKLNNGFAYFYQYNFAVPGAGGTSDASNGNYSLGLNGVNQAGYREGTLGNDQVTWEVARKADLGLEMKFFNSRLSFTGDVFYARTNNILQVRADAPIYSGLSSRLPALNIGQVTNKGLELTLGYADNAGDWNYSIEANYTYVHNNIDYRGEAIKAYPWLYSTGHPIGTEALYTWTGKFYSAEDIANPKVAKPAGQIIPGDLMFADLNGDGVIDPNDQAYQGYNETPEIMYGLNLNVGYKGFYLSTNWYGAAHVAYRPSGALLNEFAFQVQPYQRDGRWVYDPSRGLDTRATATYPALVVGGSTTQKLGGGASTFNKLDASYVRLRAAEFGYDFPKSIAKKLRLSNLRVFVSGSNLLTFTPLKKYHIDPEYIGASNADGSSNGANTGVYSPQNKFFAAGLNVTF